MQFSPLNEFKILSKNMAVAYQRKSKHEAKIFACNAAKTHTDRSKFIILDSKEDKSERKRIENVLIV